MIVIIDSIDRVGKTTLANKLAEAINGKIYKHSEGFKTYGKMTDDGETSTMLAMIDLYKLYPENIVIFDRFHLSNTVYGRIHRGYDFIESLINFMTIDNALAELDDVYLVKVNPTDIKRSSAEHGSNLIEHQKMFDGLFEISKIKNKYECNYLTMDEVINVIKNKTN